MGFFKDFINWVKESNSQEILLEQAEEIVEKLGKEKRGELYRIKGSQYYVDHIYEGYGLKIVIPSPMREEEKSVYVNYDGKRVLDYQTYKQGVWENVFSELYKSIDTIQDERKKERELLAMQYSILNILANITKLSGTITVGNGVKIVSYENTIGTYDIYDGTRYQVYKNEQLVFDGYRSDKHENKYTKYIPGTWEDDVAKYSEKNQRLRQQQYQQKINSEADERIKQLRKLRGQK